MRYESIADIYSANAKIRERFEQTVAGVSPDEATALPPDEKWNIQQIVEHVSIVGSGITKICGKLLAAAKESGKPSDGAFSLSSNFGEKAAVVAQTKVEAPDRVHPTGEVSLEESISSLIAAREAFDALRPDMETTDLSGPKFPHPFFGDLCAGEWLVMAGLHEHRHTGQIEKLLAKIRQ